MPITLSNINRFSNFFTVGIRKKFVVTLSLKIPLHHMCVATQPCEMSDIALKPATTLTYCVINVDQAWPVVPKLPRLKSGRLMLLAGFQQIVYQRRQFTTTNQMKQTIVPLFISVAGLSASWISKVDTLNIWCKNCEMWKLLWAIIETINRLFLVVNLLQFIVTDIVFSDCNPGLRNL